MYSEHQFILGISIAGGVISAIFVAYVGVLSGVTFSAAAASGLAIGVAIAILCLIVLLRGWDDAAQAVAAIAAAWSWIFVAKMLNDLVYTFRDPSSPLHGVDMSNPFWSTLWFQGFIFIVLAGLAAYRTWILWRDGAWDARRLAQDAAADLSRTHRRSAPHGTLLRDLSRANPVW